LLRAYLYHHPKVRAAEGILKRLLDVVVDIWRKEKLDDFQILEKFLDFTDSILYSTEIADSKAARVSLSEVMKIKGDQFYKEARRERS
jgi:hypothetical protein